MKTAHFLRIRLFCKSTRDTIQRKIPVVEKDNEELESTNSSNSLAILRDGNQTLN